MEDAPQRRTADARIDALVEDVANLKIEMAANTAVTTQVRDILTSMRMLAWVAKWVATIGAAASAAWHGWEFLRHKIF